MQTRLLSFLPALLLFALSGCGTTSYVTNSWSKPVQGSLAPKRIAVLALVQEESRGLRQQMEEGIVNAMQREGYSAYSTFDTYGPNRFERADETKALSQLKSGRADAVLTVVLLDKSKEQQYVPGNVSYAPVGGYYNRFWGYYTTVYDRMYVPGYYTVNTRYFWETNLYNLNQPGDDLVYSAQSESFDPASAQSLAKSYSKSIVRDLKKSGLIGK